MQRKELNPELKGSIVEASFTEALRLPSVQPAPFPSEYRSSLRAVSIFMNGSAETQNPYSSYRGDFATRGEMKEQREKEKLKKDCCRKWMPGCSIL